MFVKKGIYLTKREKFPFQKFPQCMVNTINERKVLEEFKIKPTENRSRILSYIFSLTPGSSFSSDDIMEAARCSRLNITKTSLTNILRLFCVRGIIQLVNPKKTFMRGRPQTLYIISVKTISLTE
jgi:Fe2+ or Zn2+ uptake regulation protein